MGQQPPTDSPTPASDIATVPDLEAQAVKRFEVGVKYFDAGSLELALAEFLESRRLYPLRSATTNAIVCLDQLGRYDEALELAEGLLRDFGAAMSPVARERTQRKVVELRLRVGTIELTNAEVGAAILIDGKDRGQYPPLAPLRVKAGSHLLRVIMAGFEPFETQVDIAGSGTIKVAAVQKALMRSGRLSVVEQSGKTLELVVDGVAVGKTPWQGVLALGEHVVLLQGEGQWGTLPTSVVITQDQTMRLSLVAEELNARLRIEPSPANAVVALDGITLGRGVWEGALRAGEHRLEVTAPDFLPVALSVQVVKDDRKRVPIVLPRNPRSLFAVQKPHFTIDGNVNLLFAPTFGGDVGRGVGIGGMAMGNIGYELPSRLAFGVSLGGLVASQSTQERLTAVTPIELTTPPVVQNILVNDRITLQGLLMGGWVGLTFGSSMMVQVRVGAGAMLGSATDRRSAGSTLPGAWSMDGLAAETQGVQAMYVDAGVRLNWKIRPHLAMGVGVSVLGLYVPKPPIWDESGAHLVVMRNPTGQVNYGSFAVSGVAPERYSSSVEVALVPGLGLRYDL